MAKVPEHIAKLKEKYNLDSDALWEHRQSGQWIAKHSALERVAEVAGIQFDRPAIIEGDTEKGIVAIMVEGVMGDRREWSFGEASKLNNKMAYPYAMAEKRAKDRVILKLIGLSGYVYSEEEADDFKDGNPARKDYNPSDKIDDGNGKGKSAHQARKEPHYEEYLSDLRAIDDYALLPAWWEATRQEDKYKAMPEGWRASLKEQVEIQRDKLKEKEAA